MLIHHCNFQHEQKQNSSTKAKYPNSLDKITFLFGLICILYHISDDLGGTNPSDVDTWLLVKKMVGATTTLNPYPGSLECTYNFNIEKDEAIQTHMLKIFQSFFVCC